MYLVLTELIAVHSGMLGLPAKDACEDEFWPKQSILFQSHLLFGEAFRSAPLMP